MYELPDTRGLVKLSDAVFDKNSSFEQIQGGIYLSFHSFGLNMIPIWRLKNSPLSLSLPNGVKKYYCCGSKLPEYYQRIVDLYCLDGFAPSCIPPYFDRCFYAIKIDDGWLLESDVWWASYWDTYYRAVDKHIDGEKINNAAEWQLMKPMERMIYVYENNKLPPRRFVCTDTSELVSILGELYDKGKESKKDEKN
jgi:hypothetical protein